MPLFLWYLKSRRCHFTRTWDRKMVRDWRWYWNWNPQKQSIPISTGKNLIGFNPANRVCVCHMWRSAKMTWNLPANIYHAGFDKTSHRPPQSPGTTLETEPLNHLQSWNSFSFVLKLNKMGQQCKYFHSRKWSQTHRCTAEAERGGNMVLAPEEACAICFSRADPLESLFQSVGKGVQCRQEIFILFSNLKCLRLNDLLKSKDVLYFRWKKFCFQEEAWFQVEQNINNVKQKNQ